MSVLFIILGILMIAFGFSCMFTPLLTFMSAGYFVVILVFIYGILGIIRAIKDKKFGVNFVFSILSLILGIVMLVLPDSLIFAENIMLILSAIWFVLMGIMSIVNAVTVTRKTGSKIWILELILGILGVLIGCFAFFRPAVLAISIGILIGIFFIETGFTLMFSGFALRD
ncbi:MAG: DUF308 domain-containing protein [Ruminococcus sp.]|nr:DUF308 domain-containing protein [Ruminococcus sp.]